MVKVGVSRARLVQRVEALERVARARERYQRMVELHDLACVEFGEAIRAASAAGVTLPTLARASGLSPESLSQIAKRSS
jgi:hypothetical protein